MLTKVRLTYLLALSMLASFGAAGQQSDSTDIINDTSEVKFLLKADSLGAAATRKSAAKFRAGRIALRQELIIQEVKNTTQLAESYLKKGLAKHTVEEALAKSDEAVKVVQDGIL